ncbi:MAG: hypothetical protein ACXW4M_14545, partial [Anaerolineales bacterium]
SFAGAPQTVPVAQSTSTPYILPTIQPTATTTTVPYEERIPPGWKQFKTGLVEIWLPADFEPGEIDKLLEESRQSYEELGIQELIDYNAGDKSIVNLVATDEISGSPLYRTIASISYEPLTAESLDVFVQKKVSELPSMITVAGRKTVQMGSNEAIQLVYEMRVGNIHINSVDYVLLDGMTVWVVSYSAEITEFFQQLPNFEKSIRTFRIVR